MTIQTAVNGDVKPGSFLTGAMNFFSIVTTVPCYPTNAKTPLAQVLASLNATALSSTKSVSLVDGNGDSVTYITNATYTDALNKQANLDLLVKTFATRANPVMVSVKYASIADGAGATVLANGINAVDFGSDYNSTQAGYYINLATEKSPAWLVSSSPVSPNTTNTTGYQLLDALSGLTVSSTTATVPVGPQDAGVTAITVTVASGSPVFNVTSGSQYRNLIAAVRSAL